MQIQKIDKLIEEAKAKIKKIKEKEQPVLNEKIEGDNAVEEIKKDKDHVEHPLEESDAQVIARKLLSAQK